MIVKTRQKSGRLLIVFFIGFADDARYFTMNFPPAEIASRIGL